MEFDNVRKREFTWASWQFFISQIVTILVAAISLWYAAKAGFEIAKNSDRIHELRMASNMIQGLQAEIEENLGRLKDYQNKIHERAQALSSKDHRQDIPGKIEIRDDILKTTVEKDFLYIVNGKTLSALYVGYDAIREAYESQHGKTLQGRIFPFIYNRDGMEKRIEEYEKHKKNLERINKDLQKQWKSIQEERRRLE